MKSPGWSVLVVALLLGIATGDCVVSSQVKPSKTEVNVDKRPPSALPWQAEVQRFIK
ncbi:MAG: hypothetical protein ACXVOI_07185 [Tumebacillaceae bacterium]